MGIAVQDINPYDYTKALAIFLKKTGKMKLPEWVDIVKMGPFKELAPIDDDWFYIRAASVARHLYVRSPCGVGGLRRVYGGKQRNGVSPSHACLSSGCVLRKVLQCLESLKMVEKDANTGGRRLTLTGRRDLDRIASQIVQAKKKKKSIK